MQVVPDMGAIVDPAGALPFIDGGDGHPEFAGQGGGAFGGGLDIAAGGGGGASSLMEFDVHGASVDG